MNYQWNRTRSVRMYDEGFTFDGLSKLDPHERDSLLRALKSLVNKVNNPYFDEVKVRVRLL